MFKKFVMKKKDKIPEIETLIYLWTNRETA